MRFRFALLALLPASLLQGQTAARDSLLTVSTSRSTRVVADRASLYVIVEGTAETAVDAVARAESKLKGVTDALAKLSPRVEADRPFAYTVGATPAPNGFPGVSTPPTNLARWVIRVQIPHAEQTAHVIAAVLGAGAASSSTLTFEVTGADSIRRSRISDAVAASRIDAEALAAAMGGRLGALVSVNVSALPNFQQQPFLSLDNRFGVQAATPEVTIGTTVAVCYHLIR
jgi:uncharacterized protein YggE